MVIKYTNIYQSKALQKLPKFVIFGLKTNHLATLIRKTVWDKAEPRFGFFKAGPAIKSNLLFGRRFVFALWLLVAVIRDARWFVFKPKIPIWINLGGSCNGKFWNILCPFGLFYGHLKYFMAIWYILRPFGIF
jgi:hypothetical protein